MRSSSILLLYVEFPLYPVSLRASFSFQPGNISLPHTTSPDGYFNFNSKMQSPQPLPNMLLCSMQKSQSWCALGKNCITFSTQSGRKSSLIPPPKPNPSGTPFGSHQLRTSLTDVLHQAWEKNPLRQEENFLEDERPLGN